LLQFLITCTPDCLSTSGEAAARAARAKKVVIVDNIILLAVVDYMFKVGESI
jgi:hypothetical protein